jgi:exonuclease III
MKIAAYTSLSYIWSIWSILLSSLFFQPIWSDTECPLVNHPGDRRTNKNKLRLVQYNVEWLFIDHYNAFDCPGTQCTWKNLSEAEIHMNYVSNVVRELNPDIINFCEVEGCDELNILKDLLDGSYLPYLKKGTDTGTGQNVGLLARVDPLVQLYRTENTFPYPISGSTCGYTGAPANSGVSKHFITEYKIHEISIAFISAHLLAIPTDPKRCSQREAQASVLQEVIYHYIQKNYEVIMIGDFNDYDGEVLDVNNNKPISKVLKILKGEWGTYAYQYTLHSIAETIPKSERFSDWWDSDNNCSTASKYDYSMIDHILVTENIRKYISNTFIYHGYKEYCGKYNSDHYPVVIDFLFA